jgi:hypothetical protein
MKRIGLGTICALFVSMAMFSYAQQPTGQDSGGANQQLPKKQEVPPPTREPDVKPPHGQEEAKPPKQQPEAKPPKTEKQETERPSSEQQKPAHDQHGTSAQQQPRPAGKSAHIPDPKFKANFGKQHTFTVNRVITTNTVVPNQTRFVFAGYTFIFLDPWPADWLFTDKCYVDSVEDEYFLFDPLHPGVRVALFVVG